MPLGPETVTGAPRANEAAAEPHWDATKLRDHASDVVTASSHASEVVVTFGATRGTHVPGREITVQLRQQIALQPKTARNLQAALRALIAEADAADGGSP